MLTTLNVAHCLKRHVPLQAGSDPRETTQPVIVVCGTWVRVSRWDGKPFYVWPDLVHRYRCDDDGRDRLASMIALVYHTERADDTGEDQRRM